MMCLIPGIENDISSRRHQERQQYVAPSAYDKGCKQNGANRTGNACVDDNEVRAARKNGDSVLEEEVGNTRDFVQAASKMGDSVFEEEEEVEESRKSAQVAGDALSIEILSPAFGEVLTGGARARSKAARA